MMVSPPSLFVTKAVDIAMVCATEGHSEFVTDLASKRTRLSEADVVSVGCLAAADHACLLGDEFQMLFVADTARFWKGEGAFVDFDRRLRLCLILARRFAFGLALGCELARLSPSRGVGLVRSRKAGLPRLTGQVRQGAGPFVLG